MNAYSELEKIYEKIYNLNHLSAMIGWDQATMMPEGSNQARANAIAELGTLIHKESASPLIGELIEKAKNESLNKNQESSLREIINNYNHFTALPSDLVKAKSLAGSKCEHAWRSQRKNNDWDGFAKNLNEVVNLSRQEAKIRSSITKLTPYDSMVDLYEPGMKSEKIDTIFNDIKSWLPSLINNVVEKQKSIAIKIPKSKFNIELQKKLGKNIMEMLGFNFNQGRLDESVHPFCGGVPEDVRITTRYSEDDFIQSLMGIIHETGHANYEQNLPNEFLTLPSGKARSMGIHESSSLFYEMQLGRSVEFLKFIHPKIIDVFGKIEELNFNNLVNIYHQVKPGFIRVDADEVTYPAHIILRYEIERDLINGSIEVKHIPEIWNEKMKQYLGVDTLNNFTQGPMQDIHWTDGSFGYFPSYTLGAMYAAQMFDTIQSKINGLTSKIEQGDFEEVFNWLKINIWSKGSLLTTKELITLATGEDLNPKYFKKHLENRYL